MEQIKRSIPTRGDIASKIAEMSDHLHCDICGRDRELIADSVGRYLSTGWPTHCGQTMRLVTKAEMNK